VETGLVAPSLRLVVRISGAGHQQKRWQISRSQFLRYCEPGSPRHADVEQHQCRLELPRHLTSCVRIVARCNFAPWDHEHFAHRKRVVNQIVDEQNT
jgi:hypothetical protein